MHKKIFALILGSYLFFGISNTANATWENHLRTNFLNNSTIIYTVNIRTFNADDKNGNDIIEIEEGEISGNFVNAAERLEELKNKGITALHILPVTPVGKMKALGTAGSLYSAAGYNSLNPQLKDDNVDLSIEEQAKNFINKAHEKGISIIVDVPACGSYDLFLQRPELFVQDRSGQPVIPSDWTDVRLLNAGDENKINNDVLKLYEEFVDYMISLGVDGIRADVAHSKPAGFWKELITYSRKQNPEFLWLAESSDSWNEAVSPEAVYTPYDKLLKAGFDGFYGSFFNLKNWKTSKEFQKNLEVILNLKKNTGEQKSVIGSFTTHDELSPILLKGETLSRMIIWLNATLPVNSYFVDGFDTGDDYLYKWENKKAEKTYTDDDDYFVHRGKIDLFNFSRKPGGNNKALEQEFITANNFKKTVLKIQKNGNFKFVKTSNPSVFAYTVSDKNTTILVVGNLDFDKSYENIKVKVPKININKPVQAIKANDLPKINKGNINLNIKNGEIQVYLVLDDKTVKR